MLGFLRDKLEEAKFFIWDFISLVMFFIILIVIFSALYSNYYE